MLYLSRKLGESIIINNNIEITVVEIRGKTAKLGLTFPAEASVLRKEIHDKIVAENQAARGGFTAEDFGNMQFELNISTPTKRSKPAAIDDEKPE